MKSNLRVTGKHHELCCVLTVIVDKCNVSLDISIGRHKVETAGSVEFSFNRAVSSFEIPGIDMEVLRRRGSVAV